jgi:hypothetical protein
MKLSSDAVSSTPLSSDALDTELARIQADVELVIQSAMKRMLIIVDMLPEKRGTMRASVLDEVNAIQRYVLTELQRVRQLGVVLTEKGE